MNQSLGRARGKFISAEDDGTTLIRVSVSQCH